MAAATIPSIKLATGRLIPAVGFGTGTAWYKSESEPLNRNLIESIKSAIAAGYRHLDCAEVYGTEPEVGVAIKESGIPREELFITTKLLRTIKDPESGLRESLRKLQISHVDLYLIHAPFFTPSSHGTTIPEAWNALEKLQKIGLATDIGVSNFNTTQIKSLLSSATIKPTLNQIELNPYCTDPELLSVCKEHDIVLAGYSPLAPIRKFESGPVAGTVNRIAKELGRTPAQVLLRWLVEQGHVAITTSSNKERQKEFLGLDFELGAKNIEEITKDGATEHHRLYWKSDYGEK